MVRAIKHHDYFEISWYTGPHTCISTMMSQDHSGLDFTLIVNEIWDLVKEIPTIAVAGLSAVIKNKYNYTPSYKKIMGGQAEGDSHTVRGLGYVISIATKMVACCRWI